MFRGRNVVWDSVLQPSCARLCNAPLRGRQLPGNNMYKHPSNTQMTIDLYKHTQQRMNTNAPQLSHTQASLSQNTWTGSSPLLPLTPSWRPSRAPWHGLPLTTTLSTERMCTSSLTTKASFNPFSRCPFAPARPHPYASTCCS